MNELINKYHQDFNEILDNIRKHRQKAYSQVNHTVIESYWQTGKFISNKVESANWGKGIVRELAEFIYQNDPTIKGYSDKNLWRMKQFYETYSDNGKLSPLVRELPWTHNTIIFSRCKTQEEQEFYLIMLISVIGYGVQDYNNNVLIKIVKTIYSYSILNCLITGEYLTKDLFDNTNILLEVV